MSAERRVRHPALWVPTSYLAEGIPFAMVNWGLASMFKNLGHTDGEITVPIATVTIAWSLKPLWAAFLDRYRTKKFFVVAMELVMAALFVLMALALRLPGYFGVILALLWPLAFASATQDICVDGVYITSLDKKGLAAWIGLQGVFWNVGRIFATAAVVWAGRSADRARATSSPHRVDVRVRRLGGGHGRARGLPLLRPARCGSVVRESEEGRRGRTPRLLARALGGQRRRRRRPWASVIAYTSGRVIGVIIGLGTAIALISVGWREHVPPFLAFVRKKSILGMLLFVFLYRSGEGFLLGLAPLFMQASHDKGGPRPHPRGEWRSSTGSSAPS